MKMSPVERLTLYMLANLYEKAGLSDTDPKLIKAAIEQNCEWAIFFNSAFAPEQQLPPEVREVSSIMEMWTVLERSFVGLNEAEKNMVKSGAQIFSHGVEFDGFDGNEETQQKQIAGFFIEYLDRFRAFEDRDLNSGSPRLEEYRRMLPVFERLSKTNHFGDLLAEQIIEVGNAAL